jgi:hypothetical protein
MKKTLALALLLLAALPLGGCKKRASVGGGDDSEVRDLLAAFVKPGADRAALFAALKPKATDYDAVFVGDNAAKAKASLEPLWDQTKGLDPAPDQTEILVGAATPDQLAKGDSVAEDCPAGYKGIADKLNPKILVYCFRFVKKGDTGGLAGDALVKVDDHWAYFPKPFRYLK